MQLLEQATQHHSRQVMLFQQCLQKVNRGAMSNAAQLALEQPLQSKALQVFKCLQRLSMQCDRPGHDGTVLLGSDWLLIVPQAGYTMCILNNWQHAACTCSQEPRQFLWRQLVPSSVTLTSWPYTHSAQSNWWEDSPSQVGCCACKFSLFASPKLTP